MSEPRMSLEEALKQVKKDTGTKDGYLCIIIDYSKQLVFPYKEGLKVLAAMEFAEHLEEGYSVPVSLSPLNRNLGPMIRIMSEKEYLKIKVAQLMQVPVEEVPEI